MLSIAIERRWFGFVAVVAAMAAATAAMPVTVTGAAKATAPVRMDLAVRGEGFVLSARERDGDPHIAVTELRDNGSRDASYDVVAERDTRIAGSQAGVIAASISNRQVRLTLARTGRELSSWGSDARTLCDGVASNELQFGVGWLEADGKVWVVHGPTAQAETVNISAAGAPTWCGVTTAGPNLMLLWRDTARLYFNSCSAKGGCRGPVPYIALDERDTVLGFACSRKSCLVATRDRAGEARLSWVAESGAVKSRTLLPGNDGDHVSMTAIGVGAKDQAYVVGYHASDAGALLLAVDKPGNAKVIWNVRESGAVPAVAYARGHTLAALPSRGAAADVLEVPAVAR